MKKIIILLIGISMFTLWAASSWATPSTAFFTPAITDIQPFGVLHVGVDDYFTVFRKARDGAGSFPTDSNLLIGVFPFEKLQMEAGVDLLEPTDYPLFLNAKIGTPENALFNHSPALQAGVFNVGTKKNVTNYNIGYVLIGKTIPCLGRIHGGPYYGNGKVLVDGNGNRANKGIMIGYDRGFIPVKDASGEYNKIVITADYASGKNAIGGGGAGIYYFFTKDISLLAGPVWFNDEKINGKFKITVQLDANVNLFGK